MTIIEVKSAAHVKLFHQIPFEIYKKDSNWIPHIKQDIPIFILFKALGLESDKDIIDAIIDINDPNNYEIIQ